jgi:NAD dependent epimerase/dehydratase family enzyme
MHHSRTINFDLGLTGLKKELIRHHKWLHRQKYTELIKKRIEITNMIIEFIEKEEEGRNKLYPKIEYPEWLR